MKTAEEFYREEDYPDLDRFDKKVEKFTYYELLEFAEDYRDLALQEAAEKIKQNMINGGNEWECGYNESAYRASQIVLSLQMNKKYTPIKEDAEKIISIKRK